MVQINFIVRDSNDNFLIYETVINVITFFFEVGGAIWSLLGVIRLAGSLHDKNGPGIQSALWQIVAGFAVILASILFRVMNLDFELLLQILSYASKLVIFAGALWSLYGVILLADYLRNMTPSMVPSFESSIWQIIGGVFVCLAGLLLNNIFVIIK